jgi:hypothetical protein
MCERVRQEALVHASCRLLKTDSSRDANQSGPRDNRMTGVRFSGETDLISRSEVADFGPQSLDHSYPLAA